jgi:NitT/TauT family transport system substrate-binding protein
MVAAKADMEWYHKAGQLTGNFSDLKIEDFWYMKPLMDAQ